MPQLRHCASRRPQAAGGSRDHGCPGSVCIDIGQHSPNVGPIGGIWQRFLPVQARPTNRCGQAARTDSLHRRIRRNPRNADAVLATETRDHRPGPLSGEISSIPLPGERLVGDSLFAPTQEFAGLAAPLLHRRGVDPRSSRIHAMYWSSSPWYSKRGGWFAPPTEKSQPWSPDIDHSPHGRDRPMQASCRFMAIRQKRFHADALRAADRDDG